MLPTLIVTRVPAALASALDTPNATAIGASLVPDAERGRAIALGNGELSVATALGVPAGVVVRGVAGWRATLWYGVLSALPVGWLPR